MALAAGGVLNHASIPRSAHAEPLVLQYDENGAIITDYSAETTFTTIQQGPASVQMLSAWKQSSDSSLTDPVQGSAAASVRFSTAETPLNSVHELGKIEMLDVTRALGLDPALARADMVAAAVRSAGGLEYYEYDLALSPERCDNTMATACLPSKVALVSCVVAGGVLHVFEVDASLEQWRRAGVALRNMRSSFSVV